jgi:hypothetical protein
MASQGGYVPGRDPFAAIGALRYLTIVSGGSQRCWRVHNPAIAGLWHAHRDSGAPYSLQARSEVLLLVSEASQTGWPQAPAHLSIVVGAHIKMWYSGGRLTVMPGLIILEAGSVLRRLTGVERVVHRSTRVTVIYARLGWPWSNTSIVVEDADGSAVGTTWFGMRRRLRRALLTAGFEIEEVRTLLSLGGNRVRS